MAKVFRCDSCGVRLSPVEPQLPPSIEQLGTCPLCGANAWKSEQVLEIGPAIEVEIAMPIVAGATIHPPAVSKVPPTSEQTVDPLSESEIESLEDELGSHGDFTAMSILAVAPGPDDPEDHWLFELNIDGQVSRPFRAGVVPDDAITDALATYADYVQRWWSKLKQRREET